MGEGVYKAAHAAIRADPSPAANEKKAFKGKRHGRKRLSKAQRDATVAQKKAAFLILQSPPKGPSAPPCISPRPIMLSSSLCSQLLVEWSLDNSSFFLFNSSFFTLEARTLISIPLYWAFSWFNSIWSLFVFVFQSSVSFLNLLIVCSASWLRCPIIVNSLRISSSLFLSSL